MGIRDTMLRDAKAVVDDIGEQGLRLIVNDELPVAVNCVPNAGPLEPAGTHNAQVSRHRLTVAVAKLDAPDIRANRDRAIVPGAWVNEPEDTTLRVAMVMQDRTDPGVWMLGLN